MIDLTDPQTGTWRCSEDGAEGQGDHAAQVHLKHYHPEFWSQLNRVDVLPNVNGRPGRQTRRDKKAQRAAKRNAQRGQRRWN